MSDLLSIPMDFEYNGKLYKVCKRDITIEGMFSDWVMREGARTIERLRDEVSLEFYEKQMRIFNSKVVGKQIRWGSEDVAEAAWSEEGKRHLLWLKICRGTQKGGAHMDRDLVDKMFEEDKEKSRELMDIMYRQDMPDFFKEVILPEREKAQKEKEKREGEQQNHLPTKADVA